jgi:hypothetical protein
VRKPISWQKVSIEVKEVEQESERQGFAGKSAAR